jgi:hypothetical protein
MTPETLNELKSYYLRFLFTSKVLWKTAGFGNVALALCYYTLYAGISYGPILILNSLVQHFQGTKLLSTGVLWFNVALIFALPMLGKIKSLFGWPCVLVSTHTNP